MNPRTSAVVVLAALVVAACGSSAQTREQVATNATCAARADITSSVNGLLNMVGSAGTPQDVQANVKLITGDLLTIRRAQAGLSGQDRLRTVAVTAGFAAQLRRILPRMSAPAVTAWTPFVLGRQQLAVANSKFVLPLAC